MRSRLDGLDAPPGPPHEGLTEEMPRVPNYPSVPSMEPVADPRRPGPDRGGPDRPGPNRPAGPDSRTRMQPAVFPPREKPAPEPDEDFRGFPDRDFDPDDRYDRADRLDDDVDFDELDGPDDLDEDDELQDGSPLREWLVMAGQLAVGVVAGGAVWLGFNWLWGFLPQAALVVALAVIVALVLIVRKIRRAEDLQTTVLAVLVGLVVTVSPAALLLLNR